MGDVETKAKSGVKGPPKYASFGHVSVPVRDLEESKKFYVHVLGGYVRVSEPKFASIRIAEADIGIGSDGQSYIERGAEYPHFAFNIGPDELVQMREWLAQCGIPTTRLWTRMGKEALCFFRDPSGNLIELYCVEGFKGAADLPRGPARGHGVAIDIDAIYYTHWKLPE